MRIDCLILMISKRLKLEQLLVYNRFIRIFLRDCTIFREKYARRTSLVEMNNGRILVLFDKNLSDFEVENQNPIKNSLWIKKMDLVVLM